MGLYAIVKRGNNTGIEVEPTRYRDGKYRVAKRKEGPWKMADLHELPSYVRRGYGIRMGNKKEKHSAGLFMPRSILTR